MLLASLPLFLSVTGRLAVSRLQWLPLCVSGSVSCGSVVLSRGLRLVAWWWRLESARSLVLIPLCSRSAHLK